MIEVQGVDGLMRGLDAFVQRIPQAVAAALYQEAESIIADAKTFYVPVDTGVLRDSGLVGEPEIAGNEISVAMGFGGAASAYAAVQHERMDYHHENGGPKYLERPFLDHASTLETRLAERLAPLVGA